LWVLKGLVRVTKRLSTSIYGLFKAFLSQEARQYWGSDLRFPALHVRYATESDLDFSRKWVMPTAL
jgi:hypothetical protein